MAKAKKMVIVTGTGNHLEQLKNLAKVLAEQIDLCRESVDGSKLIAQIAKQYRETIKEIEEIEGVDQDGDEIDEIMSARKADGKSDSIR